MYIYIHASRVGEREREREGVGQTETVRRTAESRRARREGRREWER